MLDMVEVVLELDQCILPIAASTNKSTAPAPFQDQSSAFPRTPLTPPLTPTYGIISPVRS